MTQFSSTHQPSAERRKEGRNRRKLATEALNLALNREVEYEGKTTKYYVIMADMLAKKAAEGDLAAIKEVFDRVEGKATTVIAGDEERPPVNIKVTFGE